jgi:hypothetical protein
MMKPKTLKLTMVMIFVGAAMLACSIPLLIAPINSPSETNSDLEATYAVQMTEVAQDVAATLNAVSATPIPATNTPFPTNTPLPTNTPAPTNTPLPTPQPPPCDAAQFVKDMTVVDGVSLPVNNPFVKIWQLKNIGTCTWTKDYEISFDGGDKLGGKTASMPKTVYPGEVVDIAISMKSPDVSGKYKGYWILRNASGNKFGIGANANAPFFVAIKVIETSDNLKLNFANEMCRATWKTDSRTIPCLGSSQVYSNYVLYTTAFELETGRFEDEPAIIANVESEERLRGIFSAYTVADGDHFVTETGCVGDNNRCKVKMVLRYQVKDSSSNGILDEWIEEHDGKTTMLKIDLSSLAGEEVIFTLDMEAKSNSDTNEVFWFMPSIR